MRCRWCRLCARQRQGRRRQGGVSRQCVRWYREGREQAVVIYIAARAGPAIDDAAVCVHVRPARWWSTSGCVQGGSRHVVWCRMSGWRHHGREVGRGIGGEGPDRAEGSQEGVVGSSRRGRRSTSRADECGSAHRSGRLRRTRCRQQRRRRQRRLGRRLARHLSGPACVRRQLDRAALSLCYGICRKQIAQHRQTQRQAVIKLRIPRGPHYASRPRGARLNRLYGKGFQRRGFRGFKFIKEGFFEKFRGSFIRPAGTRPTRHFSRNLEIPIRRTSKGTRVGMDLTIFAQKGPRGFFQKVI